ncbi:MAG: LysM peptidoglycan-binding domain-containing protein, partial [Bacteroidetes bacterium]|nr:LysM peptidoglycan-binding domain-containing protein [Bacteroidota bacterium]
RNKTIVVKKKKHDTKPLKENKNRSNWNLDLTVSVGDRDVKFNNNVKYIVAKQGDTYEKIAKDLEMFEWQLRKYNELTKDGGIVPGQVLYIQPKRSRAEKEFHKLESGETMIEVSQKYAVKLKALYRKNNIQFGAAVAPGTLLYLKKRKPPVVNP